MKDDYRSWNRLSRIPDEINDALRQTMKANPFERNSLLLFAARYPVSSGGVHVLSLPERIRG